jgi:hypothetical protein
LVFTALSSSASADAKRTGLSSYQLHLHFKVLFHIVPATASCDTFHGILLSFATSTSRVHYTPVFHTDFVPPSVFLTLSTAYSSTHLAGLFHPTTASKILPARVFPPDQLTTLIAPPMLT